MCRTLLRDLLTRYYLIVTKNIMISNILFVLTTTMKTESLVFLSSVSSLSLTFSDRKQNVFPRQR